MIFENFKKYSPKDRVKSYSEMVLNLWFSVEMYLKKYVMKTHYAKIAHVTKIRRCSFFKHGFICELREKLPHESLWNEIFLNVMRVFFSNFKNEVRKKLHHLSCKINHFFNVTCYDAAKCDMWQTWLNFFDTIFTKKYLEECFTSWKYDLNQF